MQKAVRSYITTGIALVGAGAIVMSPISVAPPEVHVPAVHASAMSVDLAAAVNPITEWVQVLQTSLQRLLSRRDAQFGHHWQVCSADPCRCSSRGGCVSAENVGDMTVSLLYRRPAIHSESARISYNVRSGRITHDNFTEEQVWTGKQQRCGRAD